MNISKELIEKAKTAKTAEELLEMAKAEKVELSAEEAAKLFAELNKTGELSDEELGNVDGGGYWSSKSGHKSGDYPLFCMYQEVIVQSVFSSKKRATIHSVHSERSHGEFTYAVQYENGEVEDDIYESQMMQKVSYDVWKPYTSLD